jgi:hypothetical protein
MNAPKNYIDLIKLTQKLILVSCNYALNVHEQSFGHFFVSLSLILTLCCES